MAHFLFKLTHSKSMLNELVPVRLRPKTLRVFESSIDKFMRVGTVEQVIRLEDPYQPITHDVWCDLSERN